MTCKDRKGYFHIYTGTGKGKSTAALGLIMRAAGAGLRIYLGEFIKYQEYSEISVLRDRFPEVTVELFGNEGLCINGRDLSENDKKSAKEGFDRSMAAMKSGNYDVVILDEICIAVKTGALSLDDAMRFVSERPDDVDLVFTGRDAQDRMIDAADIVTDMREIKHYYAKGVESRKGIDC